VNPKKIKVEALDDFCESLTRDLMKVHEKRFADRMRSVKEASAGLGNAGARLELSVKNSWGAMEKQASEYGMRLAQVIQDDAQNISRSEATPSFHDAGMFHQDAVKGLNDIILTVRRYVPKLHKMLRPEMAALNSSLTRLEKSIMALGAALDESPGLKLESLHREIQTVQEKQLELLRLRSEEDAEGALLQAASARDKEIQSKLQELLTDPLFLELRKYEESLKQEEDEIKQFLQPIIKPLLKLERAVAAKQGPSIDVKALRDLVDSPLETVMTGQRFANMQLLSALEQTLTAGILGIEERKRRKAEETIHKIKEGTLDKLRDEYATLQANTQETLRQLKSEGLLEKRDELNRQLAENHSQSETTAARQRDLQRRIDELAKTISKLKTSVESQTDKVSREPIEITTD
jgi:hypothetical protein